MTDTTTNAAAPVANTDATVEKPNTKKGRVLPAMVEKRRTLKADESLTRDEKAMKIDGAKKTVECTYTVKRKQADTVQHVVETLFDYSLCTIEEILQLATAQCRISAQALLRKMPEAQMVNPKTFRKIDVKSIIVDTERAAIDPDTKAVRSLAAATGMTLDDAEKAFLAIKQGKQGKAA